MIESDDYLPYEFLKSRIAPKLEDAEIIIK